MTDARDEPLTGHLRRLRRAVRRWRLALDGEPACSRWGCVALAHRPRGDGTPEPVVVKVVDDREDEARAWVALRHFAGRGAVRLLAHADGASLLERALPGQALVALTSAGRDDEATAILCDVAAALHAPRLDDDLLAHGFPTVADWGRGFDRWLAAGAPLLPRALVDRAAALYAELAASQDAPRLLHGDLHHFNVLRDDARGWLAVDPKGVIGERAHEPGAMLRNPVGAAFDRALTASTAVAARRAAIAAERLALDRRRVLAWGFAQAVLSAVWSWEDGESPDHALAVAEAILPLLHGG
jgi:streptomycin 6-kinase